MSLSVTHAAASNGDARNLGAGAEPRLIQLLQSLDQALPPLFPSDLVSAMASYTKPLEHYIAGFELHQALLQNDTEFAAARRFLMEDRAAIEELSPMLLLLFFREIKRRHSAAEEDKLFHNCILQVLQKDPQKLAVWSGGELADLFSGRADMKSLIEVIENELLANWRVKLKTLNCHQFWEALHYGRSDTFIKAVKETLVALDIEQHVLNQWDSPSLVTLLQCDTQRHHDEALVAYYAGARIHLLLVDRILDALFPVRGGELVGYLRQLSTVLDAAKSAASRCGETELAEKFEVHAVGVTARIEERGRQREEAQQKEAALRKIARELVAYKLHGHNKFKDFYR